MVATSSPEQAMGLVKYHSNAYFKHIASVQNIFSQRHHDCYDFQVQCQYFWRQIVSFKRSVQPPNYYHPLYSLHWACCSLRGLVAQFSQGIINICRHSESLQSESLLTEGLYNNHRPGMTKNLFIIIILQAYQRETTVVLNYDNQSFNAPCVFELLRACCAWWNLQDSNSQECSTV